MFTDLYNQVTAALSGQQKAKDTLARTLRKLTGEYEYLYLPFVREGDWDVLVRFGFIHGTDRDGEGIFTAALRQFGPHECVGDDNCLRNGCPEEDVVCWDNNVPVVVFLQALQAWMEKKLQGRGGRLVNPRKRKA